MATGHAHPTEDAAILPGPPLPGGVANRPQSAASDLRYRPRSGSISRSGRCGAGRTTPWTASTAAATGAPCAWRPSRSRPPSASRPAARDAVARRGVAGPGGRRAQRGRVAAGPHGPGAHARASASTSRASTGSPSAMPALRELALRFRGMRPPCFPSVFEAVVNAIACQQLSLDGGDSPAQPAGAALRARHLRVPLAQPGFPTPSGWPLPDPGSPARLWGSAWRRPAPSPISPGGWQPGHSTWRRSTTPTTTGALATLLGLTGSAAGAPSTRCCAAWAAITCSPATTSVPATTSGAASALPPQRTTTPWPSCHGLAALRGARVLPPPARRPRRRWPPFTLGVAPTRP